MTYSSTLTPYLTPEALTVFNQLCKEMDEDLAFVLMEALIQEESLIYDMESCHG